MAEVMPLVEEGWNVVMVVDVCGQNMLCGGVYRHKKAGLSLLEVLKILLTSLVHLSCTYFN
jgi:hypothetical protein